MPYIKQDRREHLDGLDAPDCETAGELNYVFTQTMFDCYPDVNLASAFISDEINNYRLAHGESYQTYNDIMGALHCATYERIRRTGDHTFDSVIAHLMADLYVDWIAPYEDKKITENGDVYA